MSFENMDYIIKVTRELEVGIPHIILDTSGEMNYKNLLELNTIMKKKWNFKHF